MLRNTNITSGLAQIREEAKNKTLSFDYDTSTYELIGELFVLDNQDEVVYTN